MNEVMGSNARIYVAGHRGLVGSAITRRLQADGATHLILRTHAEPVRQAIAARLGRAPLDEVEVFAELRRWKDGFRA